MKTPSHTSSSKGFTLIELLVVIAIIAVLASAGFAGGAAIMNKARKTSAQAAAVSIAQAVDNFYTEYSALPDPASNSADAVFDTTQATGVKLLDILAGNDVVQNPRKIRFLSGKEAKNGKDGIVYGSGGTSISKMTDPWGQAFFIVLDYDYDERLNVSPKKATAAPLNGKRVAVYSNGTKDEAAANASTLVKTW
jgi:prepilin-type N-terminal cleavage/methylation domain-containing protein